MPPAVSADGHHECGERRQPPAAGLHEADGGAEVEGLPKAGLNHRRADADTQDQQAEIGQDVEVGVTHLGGRHERQPRRL